VVPEFGRESLREIVLGDYRIVYRLESEAAIILTVFHSSRLFPQSLTDS
jgi:plasmid stabilization system protein ParE